MRLERLQADFAAALLDVDAAPVILPAFAATADQAVQCLALYASNVHAAWERVLANTYPVVRALVGTEFFSGLARAYGREHHSGSGDLNAFGAQFGQFVAVFEPARSLPYLGDVALLEWRVHRARYAADAGALSREHIAIFSARNLLAERFALHPAITWVESRYPIASIWRAHQPESAALLPQSLERYEWALITRVQWRVEVAESSEAEIAALATLRVGGNMADAIGAALTKDSGFDFGRALLHWLDNSVLSAYPML